MTHLISIIIPVYNRENLILETLKSISAQTYKSWECIIVDDGSIDDTAQIVLNYANKDARFIYKKRPENLIKGANSSRNYGLKFAKGNVVKWFDSDDIMLPNHLEMALEYLVKNHLDFVVTQSLNFDDVTKEFLGSEFKTIEDINLITPENFAKNVIGWMTIDFLAMKNAILPIEFNEQISIGDEYNYFIRLLNYKLRCGILEEVLSHRRIHSGSIMKAKTKSAMDVNLNKIILKYQTAIDLEPFKNVGLIKWFLSGYMQISHGLVKEKMVPKYLIPATKLIIKYYGLKTMMLYVVSLGVGLFFKNGYRLLKYARQ